jgi:hypothetical protein
MPFHTIFRSAWAILCLGLTAAAADRPGLPAKDAAEGWVQLFDGETDFGWQFEGPAAVKDGILGIGGAKVASATYETKLPPGELRIAATGGSGVVGVAVGNLKLEFPASSTTRTIAVEKSGTYEFSVPINGRADISAVWFRPKTPTVLFNGKDLTGWKKFTGNPKQEKSEFTVTPAGELSIKNGPGDLQTEAQFANFFLRLECKTNGPALNSGVFFRGLPGQYQQGYEAQIQNATVNGDRSKPLDFGTGAIYRRIAARKVAANDGEWFTLCVLAEGAQFATWVNGYPAANWKDKRVPAENARQGLRTGEGVISLQGHDPTTDLLFRNIRIVDWK